jgi:transketolase
LISRTADWAQLKKKANQIRRDVVDITVRNKAGHIAPSLSSIDILVSLYYNLMAIDKDPEWPKRDRLIFSKAHGCYGLYAILSDLGYIRRSEWIRFYDGSFLSGCAERSTHHGIEASCGSLGHGLAMATGIAFGAKIQEMGFRTYCIVGDGELQEGSNWEAVQFAVKHQLSNLTLIVDHNKLQAMDFIDNILTPKQKKYDLQEKLGAFGFMVGSCDGHSHQDIVTTLKELQTSMQSHKKPKALVAHTIKGYGIKAIENVPKFHFRIPTEGELGQGLRY